MVLHEIQSFLVSSEITSDEQTILYALTLQFRAMFDWGEHEVGILFYRNSGCVDYHTNSCNFFGLTIAIACNFIHEVVFVLHAENCHMKPSVITYFKGWKEKSACKY